MTFTSIEKRLMSGGVRNLREFGYPQCTEDNILTDAIFSQFFASMLESNKGHGAANDIAIDSLLTRIKQTAPSGAPEDGRT